MTSSLDAGEVEFIPTLPAVSMRTDSDKADPLVLVWSAIAPSSLFVVSLPVLNCILLTTFPFHFASISDKLSSAPVLFVSNINELKELLVFLKLILTAELVFKISKACAGASLPMPT